MKDLDFDDVVPCGKYKDLTIEEVVNEFGKPAIFEMIKSGVVVNDDILKEFHIKRIVHEPVFTIDCKKN